MIDWKFLGSSDLTYYGDSNDISFDPTLGDIVPIQSTNRARQDVTKILLTESGANLLYPAYGTAVYSFVFKPWTDSSARQNLADSITQGIRFLVANDVSPDPTETISQLSSVRLALPQDTRYINVNIQLLMADGTNLQITLGGILGA